MAAIPETRHPTVEAIYASYEQRADNGYRDHLGASLIGNKCQRALWFSFHWCTKSSFSGRMLRLFNTGQREEDRIVFDLRSTGATVLDVNPETGRQWNLSTLDGHFGGSMDAVAHGILEAPTKWHVCEFKTHNIKSFKSLQNKGVMESKPLHYAQMQTYMELSGMDRALYLAVCKDTDEIYMERVRYDKVFAQSLIAKAKTVINSPIPLQRISEDSSWWECRFCDHAPICHKQPGYWPERHCRSCLHSTPAEDGLWHCMRHDFGLTGKDQREGCGDHLFIPDLVPGEQVDAGETYVEYQMPDGITWRDGK